jgi:hypothetical protein
LQQRFLGSQFYEVKADVCAAAKLVDVLADERSVGETCPVVPVAISGGGAGDQTVESPEVKALVGKVKTESAPTRRANKSAGRSESEP